MYPGCALLICRRIAGFCFKDKKDTRGIEIKNILRIKASVVKYHYRLDFKLKGNQEG